MSQLLHDAFVSWATRDPHSVALRHGKESWTYGELLAWARGMAAAVPRTEDDGSLPVVAVLGEKSPHGVAAILGALLAGCAYSVIPPTSPAVRIDAALRLLRPRLLVATGLSPGLTWELRYVSVTPAAVLDPEGRLPVDAMPEAPRVSPGDSASVCHTASEAIAYVLFTSGSTGPPKGVCVSHRAATLAIEMFLARHPVSTRDRVASQVELCFDLSMFDIFSALSVGAEVVLLPAKESEPDRFLPALADAHATSVFTVPSVVEQALLGPAPVAVPSLRQLLFSGERLSGRLLDRLDTAVPESTEIWNLYGGTEMPYVLAGRVLCSAPDLANDLTEVGSHVGLELRPQPEGDSAEVGELLVRGSAIFSGYLVEGAGMPKSTDGVYATGDIVRRCASGALTMLCRTDRQVKIDGVRVDLDGIEHELELHPSVVCAVALASPRQSEVEAWVVILGEADRVVRALDAYCEARMTPVEHPGVFRVLRGLPRTPSGKKDRTAVAQMQAATVHTAGA